MRSGAENFTNILSNQPMLLPDCVGEGSHSRKPTGEVQVHMYPGNHCWAKDCESVAMLTSTLPGFTCCHTASDRDAIDLSSWVPGSSARRKGSESLRMISLYFLVSKTTVEYIGDVGRQALSSNDHRMLKPAMHHSHATAPKQKPSREWSNAISLPINCLRLQAADKYGVS